MKALVLALLCLSLAGAMSMAACVPGPTPNPTPTPTATVSSDPDAGSRPPADPGCASARQHMIDLACPPDEDAFGGWVAECTGWPTAAAITACINSKSTCVDTRACYGE